jgi:NADH:ubiquinone oxidoreductase subunit 6 (subunit J)
MLKTLLFIIKILLFFFIISISLCIFIFNFLNNINFFNKEFHPSNFFEYNFDNIFNVDVFGQFLYNYYSSCFVIAGIVLLISLLGSISLTLKYRSFRKNELSSKQLARTNNFLSFFY